MTISKEEIFERLHQLPSMPSVILELMDSFNRENLDTAELAEMISRDQGLSAKLLRVANSPFYGLPRTIGSVQDAVVVMGFDSVRMLVFSAGIMQAFPPVEGKFFDRVAYWSRSFRVAAYAKVLAQLLHQDSQMAFTAGLFHEVGELVLDACAPELFAELLSQQKSSGLGLRETEMACLGFDHALIGSEMARRWNFPVAIENAIRYWFVPEHEPLHPLAGLVYAATLLDNGVRGGELMAQLPAVLRGAPGLSWENIETVLPDREELDASVSWLLDAK